MKPLLSKRVIAVASSSTNALAEQVTARRRARRLTIDLAQGEAEDLYTPEHVKEAARRALADNRTKYTPAAGIPELREAIAYRFERDNGLQVSPAEVMASTGAKQCVFNFMMSVLNPDDEVLVPSPYWTSYLDQVTLAGGRPVPVPTSAETGFKVSGELLQRQITPRTRALVLNNPHNPSGAVYTRQELEEILDVVLSAQLVVLADEVYDQIIYDDREHVCFAALRPEAAAVTVTVNAVSKTYCMTGWRLGFASGPRELVAAMERIQSHSTSCPNVVTQWAAVAALTGDQSSISRLRAELDARRRLAVSALQAMPGLECTMPEGTFYVFPALAAGQDAAAFAEALLTATGVLVAPGSAFGEPKHVRLCFAASKTSLEMALERMNSWLN